MINPNFEISAINEKINRLEKTQVIKNYYLVLGGGKIGTDFLQHARKNKFPFVLVVDRDENAPASKEAETIKTEDDLVNLLKNKASTLFLDEALKSRKSTGVAGENGREHTGSAFYFYKMDLENIPYLLSLGIPEFIIPAVPCHATAYMLSDLLKLPPEPGENENPEETSNKTQTERRPVTELFVRTEDERLMDFFEKLAVSFPADVIAGRYPEYGMLFFSYAREGEICPDGCPGPRDRCPTFGRIKPETITEYAGKLHRNLPGWVFESHQMKPGIGGLKGREFKQNLLEILEFVRALKENKSRERFENIEDRTFFIATTCTCHGVLNLFYVL